MSQNCCHLALTVVVRNTLHLFFVEKHQIFCYFPVANTGTRYYEKIHSLTVKIIINWDKCLLLFNNVFSEFFGTKFNPVSLRYCSWFAAFPYCIKDAGEGPLKAK